eukprot:3802111-Prorocentrum_lima.AAC.1
MLLMCTNRVLKLVRVCAGSGVRHLWGHRELGNMENHHHCNLMETYKCEEEAQVNLAVLT